MVTGTEPVQDWPCHQSAMNGEGPHEPLLFLLLLATDTSRNEKSLPSVVYSLRSPQTHGHIDGLWLNSMGYKTIQKVIDMGKRFVGKKGD